jgi:2-methylcitrate dehydratase PrpD
VPWGARSLDSGNIVIELAGETGGAGKSTVLGSSGKVAAATAAFANSYLGNALDADETLYNRGHHAVATVFPALALAERTGADGRALITAVALGYDVAARVGNSLTFSTVSAGGRGPASNASLGWISFASVTAAGSILELDPDRMAHAMGIAGWTSPLPCGLRWQQITSPKPMLKYTPYGFISQQGVLAAQLAGKGFTGDPGVLDGDRGFWRMSGAVKCDWDITCPVTAGGRSASRRPPTG